MYVYVYVYVYGYVYVEIEMEMEMKSFKGSLQRPKPYGCTRKRSEQFSAKQTFLVQH